MKLSNQALGAIMMALQKSLLEQSDIVPTLKSFVFELDNDESLIVKNTPTFKVDNDIFKPDLLETAGSD
tara:strand:- start:14 stop:220 length:207 start_codon:yes stop_codon:yes gene_type:complete